MSVAPPTAKPARAGGLPAALRTPEGGLVVGILAVLGLIYALDPSRGFFQADNLRNLVHYAALYGMLAIGAAVVIIAGGIDLSIGAVAALASVLSAKLMTEWLPGAQASGATLPLSVVGPAIGLTLLMGLAVGLTHALLINNLRLPPFIATLATMAGLRSVAAMITHDETISITFRSFRVLGSEPWFTVSIFVAVALAASVMMGASVLGRHLYALGGNEAAARLSGPRTRRLKTIAYAISGVLSALGGILFTGKVGLGDPTMGVAYELYAITAAVVGGCSLAGGVGTIRGTVLGLLLIQIIISGTGLVVRDVKFNFLGKTIAFGLNPTQVEGLVLGTVIVLAVAFNQRFRGRG